MSLLALSGCVAVALLAAAAYAYTRPLHRSDTVVSSQYEHTVTYQYSVDTRPSTLYPDGRVASPVPASPLAGANEEPVKVFTQSAKRIDLDLMYELKGTDLTGVTGELSASLEVKGGDAWSRSLPLLAPVQFEGPATSSHLSVDLGEVLALVEAVEEETGYKPGRYEVTVVPMVHVHGWAGSYQVDDEYSPVFSMELDRSLITLDSDLQRSEPKRITEDVRSPEKVGALGFSLTVAETRRYGLLGGAAAACAAAMLAGVVYRGLGQSEGDKARARYGSMFVGVSTADFQDVHQVRMATIADLARIAQRDGQVICELNQEDSELFFVHYGQVVYTYETALVRKRG